MVSVIAEDRHSERHCVFDSSNVHTTGAHQHPRPLACFSLPSLGQLCLSHDSQGPGPRRSITKATVTGMVMAWLVAGLEKVRVVDRGPWLPAVGSETPTVYVMKLGSPKDFSFTKASTAGDPDFTWEEGSVEAGPQVGLQVPSSFLDMPF